jgi:hypothetical protein
MTRICGLWLLLVLAWPARADSTEKDFIALFDGKSLDGWERHGGEAKYEAQDGCIVGSVPEGGLKANSFLSTKKHYANFILEADVKYDAHFNSGIQIRSHVTPQNRVYGYQCEIDPSTRAWSGGIYDEGRRGWINDLKDNDTARKAFKKDEWNHFIIRAEGPHLRTWINDVHCADLLDPVDESGFIGLQVHAGKEGRIRWKNLRLKELPPSKWITLFDGSSLDDWRKIGGGDWRIDGKELHGISQKNEPRHGHLVTKKSYSNFVARLQYRAVKGNSGLYFRIAEVPGDVGVKGFQAEIDPVNDVGGLYETNGRGWVIQPKAEEVKKWHKPQEWNEMMVVAVGDRIVVCVNGKRTAVLNKHAGRPDGFLALQLHGGQDMDVRFRNIAVLPLH